MICPFCTSKTRIYNSRSTHQSTQTWRRHRCTACTKTFTTKERIEWTGKVDVATPSGTSPYSRERLLLSISRATTNLSVLPETLSELTDSIELILQKMHFFETKHQTSAVITDACILTLKRFDPNLALQYVNQVHDNNPPPTLIKQILEPQGRS
jgi:transcriptional regulator NrdR family protein